MESEEEVMDKEEVNSVAEEEVGAVAVEPQDKLLGGKGKLSNKIFLHFSHRLMSVVTGTIGIHWITSTNILTTMCLT